MQSLESIGTQLNETNAFAFAVSQMLNRINTVKLCTVISCTNDGAASPVGRVTVKPLVMQLDGEGNGVANVPVYDLPYFRLIGGSNAVIIDPEPGDIGVILVSDRDISNVKSTGRESIPASWRSFNLADGLFIGGFPFRKQPTQWVRFAKGENPYIEILSPAEVRIIAPQVIVTSTNTIVNSETTTINANQLASINAPDVTINATTFAVNGATILNGPLTQGTGGAGGAATMQGPVTVTNDVVAGGISLMTHLHGGVQSGSDVSGGPQ